MGLDIAGNLSNPSHRKTMGGIGGGPHRAFGIAREPSMLKLWRRFRYLIRQRRSETELAEEMEFHRAMTQQRFERNGVDTREAAHASRRVLGNVALAGEDARGVWIRPWLEGVWQDGAYAARIVRRSPALAVAIILVLGLGIGATA